MIVFTIVTPYRTIKLRCHKQVLGVVSQIDATPAHLVPALPAAGPGPSRCVLERSFPAAGTLFSHSRRAPAGSMSSPGRSEAAEQTLLVRNLESRVREEILYELFLQVVDGYLYISKCCSNAGEEKFHQWDVQLGELDNMLFRGPFKL